MIEEVSVLARDYLSQLGQFDFVYSFGVIHHTGQMWSALNGVGPLVARKRGPGMHSSKKGNQWYFGMKAH